MHPIIQTEVDEFRKRFQVEMHDSLEEHFIAALHRAIEKAGKEMVGEERDPFTFDKINGDWYGGEHTLGYNAHRSLALSKLDTIINFKE